MYVWPKVFHAHYTTRYSVLSRRKVRGRSMITAEDFEQVEGKPTIEGSLNPNCPKCCFTTTNRDQCWLVNSVGVPLETVDDELPSCNDHHFKPRTPQGAAYVAALKLGLTPEEIT